MDANGFDSDADLGAVSGVDPSLISKWQAGTKPGIENLRKVAPALRVRLGDLMVEAGLAAREELGMVGAPVKLPAPKVDASLREASELLTDRKVPERDKEELRRYIREAVEFWLRRRITDLREPSHEERGGKPPSQR